MCQSGAIPEEQNDPEEESLRGFMFARPRESTVYGWKF